MSRSRRTGSGGRAAGVLAVAFLVATDARGADRVQLRIEPQAIYAGDRAVLHVEIEGSGGGLTGIDIPAVEGLRIEGPYGPLSMTSSDSSGRRRATTVYRYAVSPTSDEPGAFRIGPATLRRRGQAALKTGAVTLGVHRRPEIGVTFTRRFEQSAGIQRDPVLVRYTVEYGGKREDEVRGRDFFDLNRSNPFGLTALELPILGIRELRVFPAKVFKNRRASPVSLRDPEITVNVQEGSVVREDGTRLRTLEFAFLVVPLRAGKIEIPAARIGLRLSDGSEEVVTTRDVFGRRRRTSRPRLQDIEATTEATPYTVERPPAAGRPPAYNDAVGRFSVSVEASPTAVDAFAPITLTVKIRSLVPRPEHVRQALLENLAAPLWSKDPELTRDFEVSTDVRAGVVEGDTVIFAQKIRPTGPHVEQIPPLSFPYYDPQKRRYETPRAAAIPIQVRAVETVDASDAIQHGPPASGGESATAASLATPTIAERAGISANFAAMGRPARSLDPVVELRDPLFLGLALAPPLVFALALLVRRRPRDPERIARGRAQSASLARLAAAAGDPEEAADAYQDFFRKRVGLGTGELTPADLRRALAEHDVPEAAREEAVQLLDDFLSARFGGGGSVEELVRRATRSIRELARSLA